jgi:hypothetical protein
MYILYMIFICIYHPSLWTFTCFGGAPCLIVYAPESHTLSNYSPTRIREEEEETALECQQQNSAI